MAENVDTSTSADSSGAGSSPRAASGADGAAWEGRVDFYILDDPSSNARLKLACKLAEKAYLAAQTVLVWHTDPAELQAFDEMLWTFHDGSFVPHEMLAGGAVAEAPVLLSAGVTPSANVDIVINLAADLPPCLAQTRRIAEIIDGDDSRRRAGRARFKAYRELGVQPASHNIRAE
jgi:DNA polymerase III subunit chi